MYCGVVRTTNAALGSPEMQEETSSNGGLQVSLGLLCTPSEKETLKEQVFRVYLFCVFLDLTTGLRLNSCGSD